VHLPQRFWLGIWKMLENGYQNAGEIHSENAAKPSVIDFETNDFDDDYSQDSCKENIQADQHEENSDDIECENRSESDSETDSCDESAFVIQQSLMRVIGTFHFEAKKMNVTAENTSKMKELYQNLVKNLPLLYSICPAKLESRKLNTTDRVLKDADKQRNVFKQLKKPKKTSVNVYKKPTSPQKNKHNKTLLKNHQ
jgi:hypothetical protein